MSNSTTFSYAQAAKGQSAAQLVTPRTSSNQSQTPSVAGSQNRDVNHTSASTRAPSVAMSIASNDIESSRSTSIKPDASRFNSSDAELKSNHDDSTTSASVAESLSSSRLAIDQSSGDGIAKTTEARGRSTNPGPDTMEYNESRKSKKSKKGKPADKDAEACQEDDSKESPPQKVELSEAPIPAVNIWKQRQEQLAKAKPVAELASQAAGITVSNLPGVDPAQAPTDPKPRPAHGEAIESNKLPSAKQGPKRDTEPSRNSANQGPKRAAPRGSRSQEKEADMFANNPASWPTPETAAGNQKPQPQGQAEKPEKEDKEEAGTTKPRQKTEWVQLPNFVHSVKFETALPGRGPRGGRVGGSRSVRDGTGSNHTTPTTNDRAPEAGSNMRTNTGYKRGQMESSMSREGRKSAAQAEHSKALKESTLEITNAEQPKPNQPGVINGTTAQHSAARASVPNQQHNENDKSSESHKDARAQNNRDVHHQGQNGTNHRSGERTRGGGRGRGGFNQNGPNGMPHHAQQSYMAPTHAYQFPPTGSRQIPPFGANYQPMAYASPFPGQSASGHRKPGSMSSSRRQGSSQLPNGRVPSMPPMSVPYDGTIYTPTNGGIYPYDSGNLLQLAQQQVEYYFSVDNCVKDWYLRTHMDSQGFVPLTFIAQFNRMRELAVDHNVLRQACSDSTVLELIQGNDGVERVRSKEGWERWVIRDMEKRDPSARHNGPSQWQRFSGTPVSPFQHPMMSPTYPVDAPPVFSPTGEHSFAHYANGHYGLPPLNVPTMNGTNGHSRPHESQLSAAVPEFSPATASGFTGLKLTSQDDGGDTTKTLTTKKTNGVAFPDDQFSAVTNGIAHDQFQTSYVDSQLTNGIGSAHETDGQ
ncbi:hypothetical protein F5Y19DRAFT_475674 [Xylariaceae sp. FL1651]|nr:hypothetical protein F5Y19DRAFT_475674 [Xylariaceae sp. FL1651]